MRTMSSRINMLRIHMFTQEVEKMTRVHELTPSHPQSAKLEWFALLCEQSIVHSPQPSPVGNFMRAELFSRRVESIQYTSACLTHGVTPCAGTTLQTVYASQYIAPGKSPIGILLTPGDAHGCGRESRIELARSQVRLICQTIRLATPT